MLNRLPDLEEVRQELARRRLRHFLEYDGEGHWRTARHLELLCAKLEAVERGEIKRLIVSMPPRHGKSEVVSKKFPAWYLGRNPWHEVILTGYSAGLIYDFSRIARSTLRERGHLWDVSVAADSKAVDRWGIKGTRGGLVAAGVGGPLTGRGAHVAIIDDPVKNSEEANSPVIRERVWQWYQSTLHTRLAPGGAIILVMTRWHEDDLAGRLLKEMASGGEQWEVINMPALAEDDDPQDAAAAGTPEFRADLVDAYCRAIGAALGLTEKPQPKPEPQPEPQPTPAPEPEPKTMTVILPPGVAIRGDVHEGSTWAYIGHVYVPVRAVAEALGLTVTWNPDKPDQVTITK